MIALDQWRHPVWVMMILLSLVLVIKTKAPNPIKLFAGFLLLQTVYIGFDPNFESAMLPMMSDYVRMGCLHAWVMFVAYSLVLMPSKKFNQWFLPISVAYFFVELIYMYIAVYVYENNNLGFMTATTQSAAMMTCFIPLYLKEKFYKIIPIFILLACLHFKSSTAGLCLVSMFMVGLWFESKIIAYITVVSGLFAAWQLRGMEFFNPGARLEMWTKYMYFFDHSQKYWTGLGFGSWDSFSRYIPISTQKADHAYFLFHNDWLQLLVEGGAIGLILGFSAFCYLLWLNRNDVAMCASLIGFGVMMCFYSPLRFAIGQIFLVFMVSRSLESNKQDS